MIHKIPSCPVSNSYYGCGDTYDSDPEDYILTPPSEPDVPINYSGDFSEYLWMENEEEFDEMEMQRLEEEALMEQCIEAMLEDEIEAREDANNAKNGALSTNVEKSDDLSEVLSSLQVSANVAKSTLNPLAAEFVPSLPLVSPTQS